MIDDYCAGGNLGLMILQWIH